MKKRIIGFWRTFNHNIMYKDGYSKKVAILITILLIIDLICLLVVW